MRPRVSHCSGVLGAPIFQFSVRFMLHLVIQKILLIHLCFAHVAHIFCSCCTYILRSSLMLHFRDTHVTSCSTYATLLNMYSSTFKELVARSQYAIAMGGYKAPSSGFSSIAHSSQVLFFSTAHSSHIFFSSKPTPQGFFSSTAHSSQVLFHSPLLPCFLTTVPARCSSA